MSDLSMPSRKPYLTDEQWALVETFVQASQCGPQEQLHPRREVVNAILYITHTGTQWRYMPHDLPDWQLVYHYFDEWKKEGTLKRIHDTLRKKVRKKAGREQEPTASILDSQGVKTTEEAQTKGYDAGKKVKGRKRHLPLDIVGTGPREAPHGWMTGPTIGPVARARARKQPVSEFRDYVQKLRGHSTSVQLQSCQIASFLGSR